MKKTLLYLEIVLMLVITQSCWAPKTIATAENLTRPILIGKVINIGDDTTQVNNLQEGEPFSATVTNGMSITSGYTTTYTQTITQGHNAIDATLLPVSDRTQEDPTSVIMIDGCRVTAIGAYWLLAYLQRNRCRIDGHVQKLSSTN